MKKRAQTIIIRDKKVLFGYGKINSEFTHFFIDGGIEKQESPRSAVIRELKEEANVKGNIVFQFDKELKKNEYTFLIKIGEQQCELGYDPEEIQVVEKDKNLQKLIWIPLSDKDKFTSIDLNYFKLLIDECKKKEYIAEWLFDLKELVEKFNYAND